MPAEPATAIADASFEEVVQRLQDVVDRLERGDLPLEASLRAFEEGIALSRAGARRLDEAEQRVEQLLSTERGAETRPLDEEPLNP